MEKSILITCRSYQFNIRHLTRMSPLHCNLNLIKLNRKNNWQIFLKEIILYYLKFICFKWVPKTWYYPRRIFVISEWCRESFSQFITAASHERHGVLNPLQICCSINSLFRLITKPTQALHYRQLRRESMSDNCVLIQEYQDHSQHWFRKCKLVTA